MVRNRTRGTKVADNVQLASTASARRVGLLKHSSLEPGEGLWIPTQAVHTFGMRFPIDVVFLDRRRHVRRVYHRLRPYRLTRLVWRAASVLELAAGVALECGIETGDELEFTRFGE